MDIIVFTSAAFGVVVGLVEVIKRASGIDERFVPLVALIVGVGVGFLGAGAGLVLPPPVAALTVWYGLVSGLGACGLYSASKAVTGH